MEQILKTPIPTYFKYVLKYCGFENIVSIATIVEDDINYFVEEVRKGNVTNYYQSKWGQVDVLEGSTKNAEDFNFSRGHRKLLMYIVSFLKKRLEDHGADCLTNSIKSVAEKKRPAEDCSCATRKRVKTSHDPSQNVRLVVSHINLVEQKEVLIKKAVASLIRCAPGTYVQVCVLINQSIKFVNDFLLSKLKNDIIPTAPSCGCSYCTYCEVTEYFRKYSATLRIFANSWIRTGDAYGRRTFAKVEL